jgi:hypothetical protein
VIYFAATLNRFPSFHFRSSFLFLFLFTSIHPFAFLGSTHTQQIHLPYTYPLDISYQSILLSILGIPSSVLDSHSLTNQPPSVYTGKLNTLVVSAAIQRSAIQLLTYILSSFISLPSISWSLCKWVGFFQKKGVNA